MRLRTSPSSKADPYITLGVLLLAAAVLFFAALCSGGCRTANNTIIAQPGTAMVVLTPITAPANSTATEVGKQADGAKVYVVNAKKTVIPAAATVIVLPAELQSPSKIVTAMPATSASK